MTSMILNYFGSKARIIESLDKVIGPLINKNTVFGDLFAGTGVVGSFYKNKVKRMVSNDMELYSYVLNKALMQSVFSPKLNRIIQSLNIHAFKHPVKGLIWKYFSPHNEAYRRMFFTCQNAMMIDSVRLQLNRMYRTKIINYKEFIFLLGSLLYSVSRFANTASTFRAYLKQFSHRSLRQFTLYPIHINNTMVGKHKVIKNCALKTASKMAFDIVYLDPPYNSNHYGGYYSFYNYLCLYNPSVRIKGVAGVTKHYNKSSFGLSMTSRSAFADLVNRLDSKYIVMSYNNFGILPKHFIIQTLLKKGSVYLFKFINRNYKPNKSIQSNYVIEYIFLCKIDNKHAFKEVWMKSNK